MCNVQGAVGEKPTENCHPTVQLWALSSMERFSFFQLIIFVLDSRLSFTLHTSQFRNVGFLLKMCPAQTLMTSSGLFFSEFRKFPPEPETTFYNCFNKLSSAPHNELTEHNV